MKPRTLTILGLICGLATLVPSTALAVPQLDAALTRNPTIVPANQEQVSYRARVTNSASASPTVGSDLTCDRSSWLNEGTIPYEFGYQWLRDGEPLQSPEDIANGSQTDTYTVQAADASQLLQCKVTAANPDVENTLDHTTGHRIAVAYLSLPALVVEPAPGSVVPAPSSIQSSTRPQLLGTAAGAGDDLTCRAPTQTWNTVATADTTAGSDTLTNVVTASARVAVTLNSPEVTFESAFPPTGRFEIGQTVTLSNGAVVNPAATIVAINGNTLTLSHPITATGANPHNKTIVAGSLPLAPGSEVSAPGIPAGATVVSVSGRSVKLSATATATATGVPLRAPGEDVGEWSFSWMRNGDLRQGGAGEGEVVASSATTSTFEISASEVAEPAIFQCIAWAEAASGKVGAASVGLPTSAPGPEVSASQAPFQIPGFVPNVEAGSATTGVVDLDLSLPGGSETRVVGIEATGWTCLSNEPAGALPAGVHCERSDALEPEQSYPDVVVKASIGADLPQPAVAELTVSEAGVQVATELDEFFRGPAVEFGINSLSTLVTDQNDSEYTNAGGHPFASSVAVTLNTRIGRDGKRAQVEFLKDIRTDTPPGFIANPEAAPRKCDRIDAVLADTFNNPTCPRDSIVGSVDVDTRGTGVLTGLPLYMLEPEPGVPAQLVFTVRGPQVTYSLIPRLRPEDGYAISVDAPAASKNPVLFSVAAKVCGYGANVVATGEGGQYLGQPQVTSCKKPAEEGANPVPFITNPTQCTGKQPVTTVAVSSWEHPNDFKPKDALSPPVTDCEDVPFDPSMDLAPTSAQADSPTGLNVELSLPTEGLETPGENATSALKKAEVTLPAGMVVNPSAADGLGACASNQIKLGSNDPISCPDSSKVGEVEVETPLLEETLKGNVYLARQSDNPFGSLLALYVVVESKERGLLVKIPGRVDPDPATGRLKTTFDDNPQVPFRSLSLSIDPGYRAPLISPPRCGSYEIVAKLYPYSAPNSPVTETSTFQVTQGPYGRPCPSGALEPKLDTGLKSPISATTSPYLLNLTRDDGSDRINGLELSLPPGLTAYLRGIPYCPDAALASVSGNPGTGQAQIDSSSCPAQSQIGTVAVKAGAGPAPFYVDTARAYLAGPYKGAPLSIAVIASAVAGPFDLGSVVVRNAAYVDPATAQITVKADPIPTILHGVPLDLREIRVAIDRPSFTLAPTSCAEMSVDAKVFGQSGASADPFNRFQVGDCGRLGFKPKLNLKLKGGTKRGENPKLIATLRARPGDANLAALSVRLPRSAFLDQAHIRTICTRVQWAADACPKGSIYGRVWVKTPLLDYTLTGNVHLRSSDNELPDLVTDLRGPAYQPIRVELSGRTDSVKGALRNSFDFLPDAPFTQARLVLFGGKRGLVVNSRDICRHHYRATVTSDAQNGRIRDFRPLVRNSCAKKSKRKNRVHRRAPM
jgi:hypothetical protein